jgi:heme-degrading monooxygenase HmoA
MTVIKINAITVSHESGDDLAQRFAARAGAVDDADGFEGFELLKPTDDREQWLVITRWRDEESFQAWLGSDSVAHGHRSAAERQGSATPQPLAWHSEVWSYIVAGGSDPRRAKISEWHVDRKQRWGMGRIKQPRLQAM